MRKRVKVIKTSNAEDTYSHYHRTSLLQARTPAHWALVLENRIVAVFWSSDGIWNAYDPSDNYRRLCTSWDGKKALLKKLYNHFGIES